MASWKEDMMKYKREKQMTAWDKIGVGQKSVDRVRWSEVSRQQRAFNPVTQTYINTSREKSSAQKDVAREQQELARARKRQEHYAFNAYDPITCEVKFSSKIPKAKPRFVRAKTRVKHDIVNHIPLDMKRYTKFMEAKKEPLGKRTTGYKSHSPEYSIVNNKFPVNDEARVHNERQMALYNATVKFQATRDYNPVKGNFYNPNKEAQYKKERAIIQKNHHIESPQSRLRLKDKTDGELYNIVNNSTLDQAGLDKKIAYDNRALEGKKKKAIFENRVKEEQRRRSKLEARRANNRVSIRREDDINMRGFDAITNQPFSGVGAKKMAPSQKIRPLSEWDKAQTLSHRVQQRGRSASASSLAEGGRKIMQAATGKVKSAPPARATPAVPGLQLQSSSAVRTGGF